MAGGALSGLCLFGAMLTQQIGIERTQPGVSAFLTANYVQSFVKGLPALVFSAVVLAQARFARRPFSRRV